MKTQPLVKEMPARLALSALLVIISTLSVAGQPPARPDARPLPLAQTFTREFHGERGHLYRVALAADEFLQVFVEQKGVDVVLQLYDSRRRLLAQTDNPNGAEGPETLSWVAEAAGDYQVEVAVLEGEAARGRYDIRRGAKRAATAQDRRRVSVERVFAEAISALTAKTEAEQESAVPKLKEALKGWRELGDAYMVELTTRALGPARPDFNPLPVGETVEKELPEGELHFYIHEIKGGQVALLEVGEHGADVVMKLYSDSVGGSNLYADRNFGEGFTREAITYVAEKDSSLILVIRPGRRTSVSGPFRYKLTAHVKAAATQDDLRRARAEQLLEAGVNYSDDVRSRRQSVMMLAQSLALWDELGDKYWSGYTSNIIGVRFWELTENQGALRSFSYAHGKFAEISDRWNVAKVYANSSQALVEMGEIKPALDAAIASEYLFGQLKDPGSQAIANNNIGRIFMNARDYEQGLHYMQKGLALARSLKNEEVELASLTSIGGCYLGLGRPGDAVKILKQALPLARAGRDRYGLSIALHNLAAAYDKMGDHGRARASLQEALLYEMTGGNRLAEANSLYLLVGLWEKSNPRLAVCYGKQAVNSYQELRGSLREADYEVQKQFLRASEFAYRHLVDLLISQSRLAEAQQVLDSYKDQQLFDPGSSAAANPSALSLTPREALIARAYEQASEHASAGAERANRARAEFESAGQQAQLGAVVQPGPVQPRPPQQAQGGGADEVNAAFVSRLEAEAKGAADKFLAVFERAEAEFAQPVSEKDNVGEVSDKVEMQAALRELNRRSGGSTVTLYTFVGATHYRALLVTPDKIIAKSIPIVEEKFNGKVVEFWNLLRVSDTYDPRPLGRELYDVLLAPVEADLKRERADTLLWSLDGALRYIPVAALYDGQQYLVERYRNVVFTRAGKERLTSAPSPRWTGLGFGASGARTVEVLNEKIPFPALPGVTAELERIFGVPPVGRGVLEGGVLLDARFTAEAFLAELKRRPLIVHIASHFKFVPGEDERSFLLLGDGGTLTLKQLKEYPDLFRGVELLTLSACNTGALRPGANGREIDTFAELAQRQGASAVMASLWAVADASTAELMSAFYRERERRGLSKAEALRQAQLALLKGDRKGEVKEVSRKRAEVFGTESRINAPRFSTDAAKPYAHPYYWSPFVLIGNGN
jgi:CHAT domain-containing protein